MPLVQNVPQLPALTSSYNAPPYKRISSNEMQLRKAKGLCFNCDEKYSPIHRCQNKKLLLLQWSEETSNSSDQEISDFVVELEEGTTVEEIDPKTSLNAMNSSGASGTMRFTGYVKGQSVKVLLDGGSDDNFIQPRVAKFLHLDIQPTATFKVLVGDGNFLQVEGKIDPFKISIQGCKLAFPVYLLPIAGAEVIMGASWLSMLGAHIMDYRNLSVQFYNEDKFVTLIGEKKSGSSNCFSTSII